MTIEKNGMKFELKLQGKEVKLTTDKIKILKRVDLF